MRIITLKLIGIDINLKIFLSLLILIILGSCVSKSNNPEIIQQRLTDSCYSRISYESSLDIESFKADADCIITQILGKQCSFEIEYSYYNINDPYISFGVKQIAEYIYKNCDTINHFRLRLYKPNTSLSLNVFDARFSRSTLTDSVFSYLKFLANEDSLDTQPEIYGPGLTYVNDIVYKQTNSIIWLNSKCSYSFQNHQKYAAALRLSLFNKEILDSLICECGAVDCK